jgi:GxxExxY protein
LGVSVGPDGTVYVGNYYNLDRIDRSQGAIAFGRAICEHHEQPASRRQLQRWQRVADPLQDDHCRHKVRDAGCFDEQLRTGVAIPPGDQRRCPVPFVPRKPTPPTTDGRVWNKERRTKFWDETGVVGGALIKVHQHLGKGPLESAYEACLCCELALRGLPFERQQDLPVAYTGVRVDCGYRRDVVVRGRILVERRSMSSHSTASSSPARMNVEMAIA